VLDGLRRIVQTRGAVAMYPASGSGAWEAAIVNTLSPGDRVLMFETGHFSQLWRQVAERFGIRVDFLPGTWRTGAVVADIEASLSEDKERHYKAVMVVHNETSTGATSKISEIRRAMNSAGHPALLMVDAVSSLASIEYRHDEWEVDVMISSSQKGLMLPPGLAFNAISEKALVANKTAKMPRSYWDWRAILESSQNGFFPYTPSINLIFGLREALQMLLEEGLSNVFFRHQRHGRATRAAVRAWGTGTRVPGADGIFRCRDSCVGSRWAQCRCIKGDYPRKVRYVFRGRIVQVGGQSFSHWASRALQRFDACRDSGRSRDGSRPEWRAPQRRRGDGGTPFAGANVRTGGFAGVGTARHYAVLLWSGR
jgi:Aminotransferase class-V